MHTKIFTMILFIVMPCLFLPSVRGQVVHDHGVSKTVDGILNAWKNHDWRTMYGYLSSANKSHVSFDEFIKKRKEMSVIDDLDSYDVVDIDRVSNGEAVAVVALNFTRNSYYSGYFRSTTPLHHKDSVTWHLVKENGRWRIILPHK